MFLLNFYPDSQESVGDDENSPLIEVSLYKKGVQNWQNFLVKKELQLFWRSY